VARALLEGRCPQAPCALWFSICKIIILFSFQGSSRLQNDPSISAGSFPTSANETRQTLPNIAKHDPSLDPAFSMFFTNTTNIPQTRILLIYMFFVCEAHRHALSHLTSAVSRKEGAPPLASPTTHSPHSQMYCISKSCQRVDHNQV
jgi:hypothetical protein